jgi:hypothetical protein
MRPLLSRYLIKALTTAASQKGVVQENGRIVRDTLLMGPNGAVKMQTIWDGQKLVTIHLYGR